MGKVKYLNRNSFNAKLYCVFYGITRKKLPRNTLVFNLKLILAYILIVPFGILFSPTTLMEYLEYRNGTFNYGSFDYKERVAISVGVYLTLLAMVALILPFGEFFGPYSNQYVGALSKIGFGFWILIIVFQLSKLVNKLFDFISYLFSKLNLFKQVKIKENIKWQKEEKDFKTLIYERQVRMLTDRGWSSIPNTQGENLWFKEGNLSSPLTLTEAYHIESQLFIAERLAEQQKKDENNE